MSSSLLCQLRLNRSTGFVVLRLLSLMLALKLLDGQFLRPRDVNIADEDSSEESIGEEKDRRRAVVKPIDLGRPPTSPGFQSWLAELYVNCCAASNRSRRRTMRFLEAVEKAPTHKRLEVCSRKWERFNAELAAACFSIRIWRGASQAHDVQRCSSAAGFGCVWSCCLVVCLAEVCCRGWSASAGRIVEAHWTHFQRTYDEKIHKRINHLLRERTCVQMEYSEDAVRIE